MKRKNAIGLMENYRKIKRLPMGRLLFLDRVTGGGADNKFSGTVCIKNIPSICGKLTGHIFIIILKHRDLPGYSATCSATWSGL